MPTVGRSALAKVDLIVSQGADNEYVFRYGEKAPDGTLVPYDLSVGWTARAQGRAAVNDGPPWFTCASPASIGLGADGIVAVHLNRGITSTDAWNTRSKGVWDLELTDPLGKRVRLVEGAVQVSHDVTKDQDGG